MKNIIVNKNTKNTKILLGVGAVYHSRILAFGGSSWNLSSAKSVG